MKKQETKDESMLRMVMEKSLLKQDVSEITKDVFITIQSVLKKIQATLNSSLHLKEKQLPIGYYEKGDLEAELRVPGDSVIFIRHTDVFTFHRSHHIWNLSYVQRDESRSYCGMIYIYNFLSDSIKFKRENDLGYLVGRIFINNERHFFVEGQRQLGFLYNDFATAIIDNASIESVVKSAIIHCLDFELFAPAFEQVKIISVKQVLQSSSLRKIATGKRLGFRFRADDDEVA